MTARRNAARRAMLRGAGLLLPRPGAAGEPRRILLIRPDHLGDLLFLTPGLHALRAALPSAHITLLAGPWSVPVVNGNSDLDALSSLPFPGFERRPRSGLAAPYQLLRREAQALRAEQYDVAVVLRFDHWWGAWLAAAAGIPRRVGYDLPDTRPFLTQPLRYEAGRHEVLQNTRLLDALAPLAAAPGPMRYAIEPAAEAWACDWLAMQGLGAKPLAAIHPGAGAVVKQWAPERWGATARGLLDRGCDVIVTGGPHEASLARAVTLAAGDGPVIAAGQTTLAQLAALYGRCAVVLGADCGPLHLAVAVGTPTVHLYGPASPAMFGPWGNPGRHRALVTDWGCAPCNRLDWPADLLPQHDCMAAFTPERVLIEAEALL
jgi:ADP-heptose:LPS heptosyltransferase